MDGCSTETSSSGYISNLEETPQAPGVGSISPFCCPSSDIKSSKLEDTAQESNDERRIRKNAAVKKSRAKAKLRLMEKENKIKDLLRENEELREELKTCQVKIATITEVVRIQVCGTNVQQ